MTFTYSTAAEPKEISLALTKNRRHYSLPCVQRFHRRQRLKPQNSSKHYTRRNSFRNIRPVSPSPNKDLVSIVTRRNSFRNIRPVSPSPNKDLVTILEQMLGDNNSDLDKKGSEHRNLECDRKGVKSDKKAQYR